MWPGQGVAGAAWRVCVWEQPRRGAAGAARSARGEFAARNRRRGEERPRQAGPRWGAGAAGSGQRGTAGVRGGATAGRSLMRRGRHAISRPAARSGRRGVAAWLGAGGAARWAQDEALPEWNGCHVFAFIVGEGKIWEKFAPRHCSKVAFATGHQKRLVWPQHTLGCWLFAAGH